MNTQCGKPWMETGRFELSAPADGPGTDLTLSIPADYMSSGYLVRS